MFFIRLGKNSKSTLKTGGRGGERIRNMRVTHLATPTFLDLDGTHETVQPPFTEPRPALMQAIAWHGTPAKIAINLVYGSAACTHASHRLARTPAKIAINSKQGGRSAPPTCPTKNSNYYGTLTVMGYTPAIPACCRRSWLKQDAQNGILHAGLGTRVANR